MLKLYIYGYMNRIQSSHRLEKESHRNVELMWLLERLTPDFKTITYFRKNSSKRIKNACHSFIGLCRQMHMFTAVVVAIDGSKFKAVKGKPNNFTLQKAKDHIEPIEQNIHKYLSQRDEADKNHQSDANTELMATKLSWLKQRIDELQKIQRRLEPLPDKQLSLTDPDARLMKTHHMNRQVCYNVQTAKACSPVQLLNMTESRIYTSARQDRN